MITTSNATPESRRAAVSAASQLGAQGVHVVLNIVSSLAIIRYLGPDRYGSYFLVVTASLVVGITSDIGLNRLGVREIVRTPEAEDDVVGSVIAARLALGVGALVLTLGVLRVLGADAELLVAGAVISMRFFTDAVLAVVIVFHVRIRQEYEAIVRAIIEAFETAIVLVLIMRHASFIALMVAPVAAAVAGVAVALALTHRKIGHLPRLNWSRAPGLLREAIPVGITLLLVAAYLKAPGLLLVSLRSSAEAGWYGAAYQPIEYLLLASAIVINVALPLLTRAHLTSPRGGGQFHRLYQRGTEALLALSIPVALMVVLAGPALVGAVYGDDFAASAAPLRLLGIALVPMVMSFWQGAVLLSGGHQRVTLAYDAGAFVLTAVLCFALVPTFGTSGAALVLLVTSLAVAVCSTIATRIRLGSTLDARRVTAIVAIGAVAAGASVIASGAGLPVVVILAVTIGGYGFALWRLSLLPSLSLLDVEPDIPMVDLRDAACDAPRLDLREVVSDTMPDAMRPSAAVPVGVSAP